MNPPDNPHAIVSIDGDMYDSWVNQALFQQVTVELTTNMASQALIRFFDPDFKIIDKYAEADGVPFAPVDVWMGFGQDLGPKLYTGLLTRTERRDTDTTFIAYDKSHWMKNKLGRNNDFHYGLNDIQIIQKLAVRNGLQFEGPDSPVSLPPHDCMIQDHKHDWKHAKERAREAGLILYVRGDTLFAKEPAKVGAPLINLIYRNDLNNAPRMFHHFDCSFKLPENHQGRHKVVHQLYRERGGKRGTGESSQHRRGHTIEENKHGPSIHQKSYASRKASASKELQREHAFVINARSVPTLPIVRPDVRDTIAVLNIGKLFSGSYLVDKISHDLTATGFVTDYSLYRDTNAG